MSPTCAAHQQVDFLNDIQEHLVLLVLESRPPPADGTRHRQRRSLGLLGGGGLWKEQTGRANQVQATRDAGTTLWTRRAASLASHGCAVPCRR
jgi:hypothetical protein